MICKYWRENKRECCALWSVVSYCLAGSLNDIKAIEERNIELPDCWVRY